MTEITKSSPLTPEEYLQRTLTRNSISEQICDNYEPIPTFSGIPLNKNTVIDCFIKVLEKNKMKELKESNTSAGGMKGELSKVKVINEKIKKTCLVKENPSIKYVATKKYSKKETIVGGKEPINLK